LLARAAAPGLRNGPPETTGAMHKTRIDRGKNASWGLAGSRDSGEREIGAPGSAEEGAPLGPGRFDARGRTVITPRGFPLYLEEA
jgi:hypothetical protein